MALKDIFNMIKADRYTADGREELIKAHAEETEDRTYNIGEISEKTGLQKTANGWVKPKSGKQPGAKKETKKNYRPFKNAKKEDLEYVVEQYKKHPPKHEIARKQRDQAVAELAARAEQSNPESKPSSSGSKSSVDIIKEKGASKINHIKKNHPYANEDDINSWLKEEWNLGDKDKERILNEKNNFGGLFSINDDKLTNSFNQWYKRNRNKKWYAESKRESRPETPSVKASSDSAPRVLTGDTKIRIRK